MTFKVEKCSVLLFNSSQSSPQANYTLYGSPRQITQETKYLNVSIQFDLRFTSYIYTKISKTRQQLGTLFKAPENAKLLAYCADYV